MSSDSACAVCSALCVGWGRFQGRVKRYASFQSNFELRLPVPEFYKRPLHEDRLSMTLVKSPSLFFSCCLAHPLSSNIGQVVVFIIRFMISPHYKNNLKPLR